ncbi:MAG: hypothetical protein H7Y60_01490 [Rhodospirillaceae bacterium]|nr:hypothetical protein [Rhodospirillales bacterium]
MVRMNIRLGFALLALAVASPARAEDSGSDWLGSVGDFVRSGLGPPRTLEDIRREEQQRVLEGLKPAEPKLVQPLPAPVPVAAPAPVVEPEVVAPVVAAPEIMPAPEPKKAQFKAVPPMPVPEAKPKPVIVRAPIVPPPPEPLTSRIAATATLDQAVKLGGSAEIYSARIKSPPQN